MKKKLLLITLFVIGLTPIGKGQDCNIGNEINTNSFQAGSLLGGQARAFKRNLSQDGILKSMTFITGNAGDIFRMAMYSDNSGEPGTIVASTNAQTSVLGDNTVSLPSTNISAGDYWLMIVFDNDANLGVAANGANDGYEMSVASSSAFPITANGNLTVGLQDEYLLAVEIECVGSTNSLAEENDIDFKIYPNPTTDFVTIGTELADYQIEVTDLSGKILHSGSNSKQIDMEQWSNGIYLVSIKTESELITRKIIKK